MIDRARKAVTSAAAPTARSPQKYSFRAIKQQIYLFAIIF